MTTAAQLRLTIGNERDERWRLQAAASVAASLIKSPSQTAPTNDTGEILTVPARRRSKLDPRVPRYFGGPRKPYQRSPNPVKALTRRRVLAWRANAMPDHMRMQLTESQRALANLIREHHERHGYFDLCHDAAAALIGSCAKTVQRAQHALEDLEWISVDRRPQPGRQKHLPNVIKIISREWLTWIERGSRTPAPIESGHSCPATQSDKQEGNSFANSVPVAAAKRDNGDACGVASLHVKEKESG